MKITRLVRRAPTVIGITVSALAVGDQLRRPPDERDWHGKIWFIPYDFRRPTLDRVLLRVWNADDARIITPHVFGVGWTVNWYQVAKYASSRSS